MRKPDVRKMIDELQPKQPVVPGSLDNQILSRNPLQRLRQLDWQAQQAEQRIAGQ